MIWGLLAALGWGSADVLGAVSGRSIGSLRTAVVALGTSMLIIGTIALATGQAALPAWDALRFLIGSGLFAGCAYLSLYRALELGPVAIVSPVVSAFAAITVVLDVVFAGEHISALSMAGMLATFLGVACVTAGFRGRSVRSSASGWPRSSSARVRNAAPRSRRPRTDGY